MKPGLLHLINCSSKPLAVREIGTVPNALGDLNNPNVPMKGNCTCPTLRSSMRKDLGGGSLAGEGLGEA